MREMAPKVIAAGAELLFIQGTLVSAEHVATGGEPLNLKEFIGSLDVPVIAGGVTDYTTALHLMRTGAAGVIVGAGVTTNAETVGIDSAMGTAIADAAAARRDYLDETGGRYVHIIADTEFENSGNIAKAFACGADGVVLGPLLAQAREAGGRLVLACHGRPPAFPTRFRSVLRGRYRLGRRFPHHRYPGRSHRRVGHPVAGNRAAWPSSEPFGRTNLVGALRRSMAKCGYTDLKSFQKVELAVRY